MFLHSSSTLGLLIFAIHSIRDASYESLIVINVCPRPYNIPT